MVGFENEKSTLDAEGIKVIAASIDTGDEAKMVADEVSFPVGQGVTHDQAMLLDAWWEDRRGIIQPSEFLLGDDGRVVSNFIIQALTNKDITIYGDGKQTRSFCYVDDLVNGIFLMMKKENFPGPVNLGNPSEISIRELAKEIINLTSSGSKLINHNLPEDDPKQRCPDITLANEKLEWQPKFERIEGLKKTVKYFKELIKNEEK